MDDSNKDIGGNENKNPTAPDQPKKSVFEFEGAKNETADTSDNTDKKPDDSTPGASISSPDEKQDSDDASPNFEYTTAEKAQLAAAKTKDTAKSLKDKVMSRFSKIESSKVRSAVLIGSGAVALVLVVVVGVLVAGVIRTARTNRLIAAQERVAAESVANMNAALLNFELSRDDRSDILQGVADDIASVVSDRAANIDLYRAQSIVLTNLGEFEASNEAAKKVLEMTEEYVEQFFVYQAIIVNYSRMGNFTAEREYLERLFSNEDIMGELEHFPTFLDIAESTLMPRLEELRREENI